MQGDGLQKWNRSNNHMLFFRKSTPNTNCCRSTILSSPSAKSGKLLPCFQRFFCGRCQLYGRHGLTWFQRLRTLVNKGKKKHLTLKIKPQIPFPIFKQNLQSNISVQKTGMVKIWQDRKRQLSPSTTFEKFSTTFQNFRSRNAHARVVTKLL